MSTRELSKYQAANGVSIAGTDVSHALRDAADVLNDLQPKHLERNYTRKVWCIGHSPSTNTVNPRKLPWLPSYNSAGSASAVETPTTFDNPYRYKGDWNDDIDPVNSATEKLWTMEWAVIVSRPSILRRMVVSALVDSAYVNTFRYGVAGPTYHGNDQPVYDLTCIVQADDIYAQGKRELSLVPAIRRAFKLDGHMLSKYAPLGGTDTGLPAYPTGSAQGLMFDMANHDGTALLDTPIPAGTRLRFIVQVPQYLNPASSSWGAAPWMHNLWGITIWMDEQNA